MSSNETFRVPMGDYLQGLLQPMSTSSALDPFAIKNLRKTSPRRIAWTVESRVLQRIAGLAYNRNMAAVRASGAPHRFEDRGAAIADTAVTERQRELLLLALQACAGVPGEVAEIGSFRGVTTCAMARATAKTVNAIDPFINYGGSEQDFARFTDACKPLANIRHLRLTSGQAAKKFAPGSLAFVFIDGVHDFSNSWFDFAAWSARIAPGGMVALHDVDDHEGVTMTCARVLGNRAFRTWGYCPNLIVFQKA